MLAAAVVRQAGKILVIREEDEPNRHAWVFPQGYPLPGETLRDAARREVFEELGLDVELDGLLGTYDHFTDEPDHGRVHWVTVCFLASPVRGSEPKPSVEAIDFAWLEPTALISEAMPMIRPALADIVKGGHSSGG